MPRIFRMRIASLDRVNITNHPGVPYPECAYGGFRPGLFGRQYKPIDPCFCAHKGD